MTISYNWLVEYLPEKESIPNPQELSDILTDIGLEVESLEKYDQIPGGLKGLVIGEIKEVKPHPNADRLRLTRVDVGGEDLINIVCGAPNVKKGQKVVVAQVGTTIYPVEGEPVTMKKAKIRGEVSIGMLCAEDELGLGESHDGIMDLDGDVQPGMKASEYFQLTEDWIYEIGLTPNRMDAMSHLGVARDVCAKLNHENRKEWKVQPVSVDTFKADNNDLPVTIIIENETACPRYTGVTLSNIKIAESPEWLQERLKAIGVRPINNVVDITNYVLHECGQPLHAFDLDAVKGDRIKIKNLPAGTPFVTLDKETRKLRAEDLMICNEDEPMCIAGIFGGLHSGVTDKTTSIFLESACFDAVSVRRTSFYHGLRTDAAMCFEKGVDISGVAYALKRAALLMVEFCGAQITSDVTDNYPQPKEMARIVLKKDYLVKLSGKNYTLGQAIDILSDLGFELLEQSNDAISVAVPYNKPDMTVAADLVEEIMRIDGYGAIEIPSHIRIAPSTGYKGTDSEQQKEKIVTYLTDNGFYEIMTNSITNSKYYEAAQPVVKLLNNLSSELDILRPSVLETGLEAVAHNLNRKQENILFFEIGNIYAPEGDTEKPILALWASGNKVQDGWIQKAIAIDPYFLKGHLQNLFVRLGISSSKVEFVPERNEQLQSAMDLKVGDQVVGKLGLVSKKCSGLFDIKQEVWYAEVDLLKAFKEIPKRSVTFKSIPKYPVVRRDLALVLDKKIGFSEVENIAKTVKSRILDEINLFDVFEGEKLGIDKKSYAVSFTFRHPKKTLTDKEIDKEMKRLIQSFEKQLSAEIRS